MKENAANCMCLFDMSDEDFTDWIKNNPEKAMKLLREKDLALTNEIRLKYGWKAIVKKLEKGLLDVSENIDAILGYKNPESDSSRLYYTS